MAEGRTSDKSSNANCSLQDYSTSIEYYEKRLAIARECEDVIDQRRAHTNLGNAYLYLEDFDRALYHYREAMIIGEMRNDDLFLAQMSFIMGCVYNIKHEYKSAIYFHEKHFNLAQQFQDCKGQSRACYILSQLYNKIQQNDKGEKYMHLYSTLIREIEQGNEIKLEQKKNLRTESVSISGCEAHIPHATRSYSTILPDDKSLAIVNKKSKTGFIQYLTKNSPLTNRKQSSPGDPNEIADLVHRMQKSRFDDQRCVIRTKTTKNNDSHEHETSAQLDDVLNAIDRLQQHRLDDQRTTFPRPINHNNNTKNARLSPVNEQFFDQLAKSQNSRMNDQRAVFSPLLNHKTPSTTRPVSASSSITTSTKLFLDETTSTTLPDEEFFSLLNRLQSRPTDQHRGSLSKRNHKT